MNFQSSLFNYLFFAKTSPDFSQTSYCQRVIGFKTSCDTSCKTSPNTSPNTSPKTSHRCMCKSARKCLMKHYFDTVKMNERKENQSKNRSARHEVLGEVLYEVLGEVLHEVLGESKR